MNYYDEKSKGGYISLVIIEHSFITEQGKADENQISVAEDSDIDGLSKLASIIHKNGSKAAMQLNHAGSGACNMGFDIVAPSAIAHPVKNNIPIELTRDQIKKIVEEFKAAALRTKKAVNIPVILTGGVTTAEQAEELLNKEMADLIGVGRAILKDSNWAKEAVQYLNKGKV